MRTIWYIKVINNFPFNFCRIDFFKNVIVQACFHYARGMEHSWFVLLIFFASLSARLDFMRGKINKWMLYFTLVVETSLKALRQDFPYWGTCTRRSTFWLFKRYIIYERISLFKLNFVSGKSFKIDSSVWNFGIQ